MHSGGPEDIATLIRNARKAKGLSQSELARRIGAAQQTIEKLETGKVKRSSFLAAIAMELGIPVDRVVNFGHKVALAGASMGNVAAGPVVITGRSLVGEANDLPVYAITYSGVSGVSVLSANPVEHVLRPAPLARVRDGYGVMLTDDSMAPEFRSGDVALVNPHLPPRVGDTCIFKRKTDDGAEEVTIRHLCSITETSWKFVAWNDGDTESGTLKRAEWQKVHVVVGAYKRR